MPNPPTTTPPTDARVFDDDEQAANVADLVDDEMIAIAFERTEMAEAARSYFRLRHVLLLHMGDLSPWLDRDRNIRDQLAAPRTYPVDLTGAEVAELELYIAHLSQARHGTCTFCNRWIFANQPIAHVHRDRPWHPRVLWRTLVDVFRNLAGIGDYQLAHHQCAGDRACPEKHWA